MNFDQQHPALYPGAPHPPETQPEIHFVPEGWEHFDIGICPCGAVVRWDNNGGRWTPMPTARVLVLTREDVEYLRTTLGKDIPEHLLDQIALQDELDLYDERQESP